ncbi:COG3014 family protein [Sedimentisphaera salicampi]|uniref:Tetratricopeptide repeat protein n=1 Tax=Sedimentisphaera salicampi TaxID=1941349 RepID=A0A1W6LP55_9BACT|nr:hypothetical protein [Sedimentisphaera salicampi]ARN57560.1 hypothetical protein STSP1_01972 [Sedimentisphaera salicampi]OXU14422.1 hypothetical protein SMSP1_01887 [Sedimentisphaera salicampi]
MKKSYLLFVFSIIFLAGCSSSNVLRSFDSRIVSGDYGRALMYAESRVEDKSDASKNDVLWNMQAGTASRIVGLYEKSSDFFSEAEEDLKEFNLEKNEAANQAAAAAVNDNILPYYPMNCEAVMLNTYKALNMLALGQWDNARIEFNRAIERQRRAKNFFAEKIQAARNDAKQESLAQRNLQRNQLKQALYSKYPSLKNFEPYGDYINPFLSYAAGIYFKYDGEDDKAEFLLKQAAGAVSESRYAVSDFENFRAGKSYKSPRVWIFFENGLAAYKEEFRIDLPIMLESSGINYVGIALPKLKYRSAPVERLKAAAGGDLYFTEPFCSMDRVIQAEFGKTYAAIFTRAVVSATMKAAMQYALYKEGGSWLSLAGAAYSFATTSADCRSWSSLPKEFQVLRMERPENGEIVFMPGTKREKKVEVPPEKDALVFVRAVSSRAELSCEMIELN